MQKPEIWKLVMEVLMPNSKRARGFTEWQRYVSRFIVAEVRLEIVRFFGSMRGKEPQNPGLDYTKPAHRLRLEDFPHHKRLFDAFDKLRLTDLEIYQLCNWYGAKGAKDEYERKHAVTIRDTTWDGIHPYSCREPTVTIKHHDDQEGIATPAWIGQTPQYLESLTFHRSHRSRFQRPPSALRNTVLAATPDEECELHTEGEVEAGISTTHIEDIQLNHDEDTFESDDTDEFSGDDLEQSVGFELNLRLLEIVETNTAARARGEDVPSMDAAWEQWLKDAAERGLQLPPLLGTLGDR